MDPGQSLHPDATTAAQSMAELFLSSSSTGDAEQQFYTVRFGVDRE